MMKRYRFGGGGEAVESINVATVLMLLSQGGVVEDADYLAHASSSPSTSSVERVFECKTCNRQFPSFQALGGHRASHKKPKLAAEGDGVSAAASAGAGGMAKPRVHECSICGVEFAIGQALGGHMRRHRVGAPGGHASALTEKKSGGGGGDDDRRGVLQLDLNLPPLENDLKLGLGLEIVH